MRWSQYQHNIFRAAGETSRNLLVRARAGSGKTTTAVAALDELRGGTLMVAFNEHITRELRDRVPDGVDVRTLHSLGLHTVNRAFGRVKIDKTKGIQIARRVADNMSHPEQTSNRACQAKADLPSALRTLAGLLKGCLPQTREDVLDVVYTHDAYSDQYPAAVMADAGIRCLQEAAADQFTVDFDDMLYFPAKFNLRPLPYSSVVVDETQDLNPSQLLLTLGSGSRVIAIGDDRQAIYHWRGAGTDMMGRIQRGLDADVLPLSVTYRCASSIVDYVTSTIEGLDDFEARPNAPAGQVVECDSVDARPGDFVLARWNARLVPLALAHAHGGYTVCVLGHDIAKSIGRMLRGAPTTTCASVVSWARERMVVEARDLIEQGQRSRVPYMRDRYRTLVSLAERVSSPSEIGAEARRLFTDVPKPKSIVFSTVHRAKGHERDRVWLDLNSLRPPGYSEEEDNIHYVGATRARHSLFLVRNWDEVEED